MEVDHLNLRTKIKLVKFSPLHKNINESTNVPPLSTTGCDVHNIYINSLKVIRFQTSKYLS